MATSDLSWISPGLGSEAQLVSEPEWYWKEKTGAVVDAWSVADDFTYISDQTIARLNELTQNSAKEKGRRKIVEFNCGLVYAPEIQVGNRTFHIDGRKVSIDYNRLLVAREFKDEFARQVAVSRAATQNRTITTASVTKNDMPVYVQARDIHYFFHFMTETLPQFATIQDEGLNGPITLCDLNDPPSYVMGFVEAQFPQLSKRLTISGKRENVKDALIVADLEDISRTHAAIDFPPLAEGADMRNQAQSPHGLLGISTMFSNSHSANLRRLAEIGRERVADMDKSHLPKRFLISRQKAKRRKLVGEDKLLQKLKPFGIEPFIAEDYTPLEQIAAFSQAELILAPHGAGMTNVLFASPDCHAIELTQRQYVGRARHFIRLADVAGCGYEVVLCDEAGEHVEMKANVGNDVALSDQAIDKITSHVSNLLENGFQPSWRLRKDTKIDRETAVTDISAREGRRYRFFGMQRSGNHAVINWVIRNLQEDNLFLNCCSARKSPYETFTQVEVNGQDIAKPKQAAQGIDGVASELKSPFSLLVSYENHAPTVKNLEEISQPNYKATDFDVNVLIYRSYANWLASYVKLVQSRLNKKNRSSLVEEIALVGRAVSQYTEMLAPLVDGSLPDGIVAINYDKWCLDADYRAGILERMDLPVQDNSLGHVQGYGGGSSFDDKAQAEADPKRFALRSELMQGDFTFDMFAKVVDHDPGLIALQEKGFI